MTRRGSIADQLSALWQYSTIPDHEPEPIQTNWSITPSNDNNPEDIEGMKQDKLWDVSPSIGEIMRNVREHDPIANDVGLTVRWGSLRFSDGTQTEQGFKLTIDGKVVVHNFPVPAGGMLGTTDKERAQRGGDDNPEDVSGSMAYFAGQETEFRPAGLFKAKPPGNVKRTQRKERTGPKTKDEERKLLASAIANTENMPEVNRLPDGFPSSPKNLAQLFPGMVKTCTGQGGSQAWVDIASMREERAEFFKWVDELPEKQRAVLDAARSAKTLADVGVAAGQSHKYAKYNKGGRRALIAANDNLLEVMKKYAR